MSEDQYRFAIVLTNRFVHQLHARTLTEESGLKYLETADKFWVNSPLHWFPVVVPILGEDAHGIQVEIDGVRLTLGD